MPSNLSISNNSTKYICKMDETTKTLLFVEEEPGADYNGASYQKQEEGKFGIYLEDKCRAYETIRRAETGYDRVTDEFVTYFLQRLYTLDYKVTEDKVPYSNKPYFLKKITYVKAEDYEEGKTYFYRELDKDDETLSKYYDALIKSKEEFDAYEELYYEEVEYNRFYGFTFDTKNQQYYELNYTEFLKDGEPLSDEVQYYVKSKVPEYIPTIDKDPAYYLTNEYKSGQTYYYFNEIVRQYI
jgi:hypothetical protein